MNKSTVTNHFPYRKIVLSVIFIFVLIHFLKDITQDILKIQTPLDIFGDIKEDLSSFPSYVQSVITIIGISSFFAEAFLLLAILTVIKRNTITSLEKGIYSVTICLIVYFIGVALLDPQIFHR